MGLTAESRGTGGCSDFMGKGGSEDRWWERTISRNSVSVTVVSQDGF